MKKLFHAKVGLTLTSLSLIVSIFAFMLINGSVAWFSGSRETKATGLSITMGNTVNVKASLKSYPVSNINTDTGAYTVKLNEELYELPVHDDEAIVPSAYLIALYI